MKNKFKRAGIWNIVCGAVGAIAWVLVCVFIIFPGIFAEYTSSFLLLFLPIGAFLMATGGGCYGLPVFTGMKIIKSAKKGLGIKLLLLLNIAWSAFCAMAFLSPELGLSSIDEALFIVMGVAELGSVIVSTYILLKSEKKEKTHEKENRK